MEELQQEHAPPRVSVLIVSSNNAAALRRCLTALGASQSRQALEIIVVDSGSADECPQMDVAFPGIQLLRLPRNFGAVKALNIGMRTATGEFFLFLAPEMELAPDSVSCLVERLEAAPDAVGICPLVRDEAGEPLSRIHPLPLPAELQQACRYGDFAGWTLPGPSDEPLEVDFIKPPAMMVRSYFLKGLRYIDDRYGNSWWDLEICTQIRRASKKILLLATAQVVLCGPDRPLGLSPSVRGLLAADRLLGAAVWVGKHYGWAQAFKFRMAAGLRSLGSALLALLRMRDVGYRFALLSTLVSGQKLDGSQRAL